MKRVFVSVEGQTEETFVRDFLAPHLSTSDIFLQPVVLSTKRPAAGEKFKGGATGWSQIEREIRLLLRDSSVAAVTTMFDLYGLPADVPGLVASSGLSPYQRVNVVESSIDSALNETRFRPYLQLHEFEALVFVAPEIAARRSGSPHVLEAMNLAIGVAGSPELVNESPLTAPSKRLRSMWPGYVKTLDGPAVAAEAGLPALPASCPHFGEWVTWLLSL